MPLAAFHHHRTAEQLKYADTLFGVLCTMRFDFSSQEKYNHVMDLVCKLYDLEPESESLEHIYTKLEDAKAEV